MSPPDRDASPAPAATRRAGPILVVEDNPISLKMVSAALLAEGYEVVQAGSGAAALDCIGKHAPQLVLQDLLLPDVDGCELARRLHVVARAAPILALSGSLSRLEQARASGEFRDYLMKPVEPSRLTGIVRQYLAPDRPAAPAVRHKRILLVDDNPMQLKWLALRLRQAGFEVTTAVDGLEAITKMETWLPDAVLSDVLMPQIDGFQLCLVLRQDPRLKAVPVILASSNYIEGEDRRLAQEVGADALVFRSAGFDRLLGTLEECLSKATPAKPRLSGQIAIKHSRRIQQQLERQVDLNTALQQRSALQFAALSVLSALAQTLGQDPNIEARLDTMLAHILDSTGLARGAIYLTTADGGTLTLGVELGCRALTESVSEAPQVLRRVLEDRCVIRIPSQEIPADVGQRLLAQVEGASALLAPLIAQTDALGVLLLLSDGEELLDEDWRDFVQILGAQLGQAINRSRIFARLEQAELKQRQLAEDLQSANQDLESFSSSVAHDLRGPLRAIGGFSDLITRNYSRKLGTEGRELFAHIQHAAQHMNDMIDALLRLARVSRADLYTRSVDLSALAEKIRQAIEAETPQRKIDWKIAQGIVVQGDKKLLEIALGNLLRNACKFTGNSTRARIAFGVEERAGQPTLFVKDNGAGFDMKYADKLFTPFKRLHNKDEFPGIGIGLATVQRIVQRHGGRIWAEGKKDEGAAFYWTL